MKAFFQANKKTITAAILVAIVVFIIYQYGKGKGSFNPLPTDGGTGSNANLLSTADAQNVRELVLRIKSDIYGVNVWQRDTESYYTFSAMSDTLFVAVCNDYKNLVGNSIRTDMESEYYNMQSIALGGVITAIYQRMDRLNIQ